MQPFFYVFGTCSFFSVPPLNPISFDCFRHLNWYLIQWSSDICEWTVNEQQEHDINETKLNDNLLRIWIQNISSQFDYHE